MIQESSTTMTYTDINNTSENLHAVDKSGLINFFQSLFTDTQKLRSIVLLRVHLFFLCLL
jgi:hypothetical protein